jgi:hypothetical protein
MHPQLVAAVLCAVRWYLQAACPAPAYKADVAPEAGSFTEWNQIVRGLLVTLGFGDPLATQKEVRAQDPYLQDDIVLIHALHNHFPKKQKFCAADLKKLPGADIFTMFTDDYGRFNPHKAGLRLRGLWDRLLDGLQLVSTGHPKGVAHYCVVTLEQDAAVAAGASQGKGRREPPQLAPPQPATQPLRPPKYIRAGRAQAQAPAPAPSTPPGKANGGAAAQGKGTPAAPPRNPTNKKGAPQ